MTRAAKAYALLAVALSTLVLAACGGSSGPSGVKPSAYVKSMCTALGTWKSTIQRAGVALQSSGAGRASRPAAKADYQRFVSALVTATQRATGELRAAGTPTVDQGQQIAGGLTRAFDQATRGLSEASRRADAIPTDSPSSFQSGASSVTAEIKSALEGIAAATPGRSAQLRAAAANEPSCQVLRG